MGGLPRVVAAGVAAGRVTWECAGCSVGDGSFQLLGECRCGGCKLSWAEGGMGGGAGMRDGWAMAELGSDAECRECGAGGLGSGEC